MFGCGASAAAPEACGGCDGGVIYIDAERKFSGARMAEIARGKFGDTFDSSDAVSALADACKSSRRRV